MTDKPISPLRQRMIEDMTARHFAEKAQTDYIRYVKSFAAFLGRSPDTAGAEDLRLFQHHMTKTHVSPGVINATVVALRFFFKVTLERDDLVRRLTLVSPPLDLAEGVIGETYPARLGDAFQPRGDIDAVATEIAVALRRRASAKAAFACSKLPSSAFAAAKPALRGRMTNAGVDHFVVFFNSGVEMPEAEFIVAQNLMRSNSPSGPPADARIPPWLSNTAKVSACLSVWRGRANGPIEAIYRTALPPSYRSSRPNHPLFGAPLRLHGDLRRSFSGER